MKDPSHHPSPEAEQARYDQHQFAPDDGYDRMMEAFLQDSVLPFLSHGSALDFGCGRTGNLIGRLRDQGFAAAGYDPFYAPDPAALSARYDLVTATEVVEHFRDPKTSWRRLFALVAPGGTLSVTTRFIPADFAGWWYRRDLTPLCFYTERALQSVAGRHGFKVIHTDGCNAITFHRD